MSLLGIDVGGSGCKVAAFDIEGRLLGEAHQASPIAPAPIATDLGLPHGVVAGQADSTRRAQRWAPAPSDPASYPLRPAVSRCSRRRSLSLSGTAPGGCAMAPLLRCHKQGAPRWASVSRDQRTRVAAAKWT